MAAAPAQPGAQQAILLGSKYGPNSAWALQQAQMFADQLQALQQNTTNIRTPASLGVNLLADAILQSGKKKADKEALEAFNTDRKAQADAALQGLPSDAGPAPQLPPSQPQTPPPQPQAPAPGPGPGAPAPQLPPEPAPAPAPGPAAGQSDTVLPRAAALARGLRNNNPLNLTTLPNGQTWNGQTGADGNYAKFATPQDGWTAADKNLSAYGTKHGIDTARGIADRWAPDAPPTYRAILAKALGAGPDDHVDLTNPDVRHAAETAMAGLENGGPVPFGQGAPPAPSAIPATMPALPPPAPAPQAGGASPIPRQTVTPEEVALARRLMADPRTYDQGVALAYQLQAKQAAPVDPSKPYWGNDGKAHYAPGTTFEDVQGGAPNVIMQRGPDNQLHAIANPAYGPVPAGSVMGRGNQGQGEISQIPIQQAKTFRMQGVNGVFVTGPDGRPVKVGDDQYGPEQVLKMRDQTIGSDAFKNYQQAADAYGAMISAAKQNPSGMRAYAMLDTFARAINPGAVARVGTIQAIKEARGVPASIEGWISNLKGDGNVPPEIAQQILDVTQGFVASHYTQAKALNDSNADYARRHEFNPADVLAPIGGPPEHFAIPSAAGPGQGRIDLSRPLSPQEAATLPAGTRFIGVDGKPRVRQ